MTRRALIAAHREVLEQAQALVGDLDAPTYAAAAPQAGLASVGAHLRHLLDMYGCFVRGLATGRVDYEARARDARLEVEPAAGRAALGALAAELGALAHAALPERLLVHGDTPVGHEHERVWAASTPERELQFLLNHTLHHCALIAAVLRLHGRAVPREFGLAPSTIRWLAAGEESRACVR
jgi:uncharacterized damage-inducible protein DinB